MGHKKWDKKMTVHPQWKVVKLCIFRLPPPVIQQVLMTTFMRPCQTKEVDVNRVLLKVKEDWLKVSKTTLPFMMGGS